MYKIIGGDAREYGPVSADQIRQWIAEQRANGQTHAQREGEADWRPLTGFPEFADALGVASPEPPRIPPAMTTISNTPAAETAPAEGTPTGESVIDIGHCLGRGWALVSRNLLLLGGATALVWLIVTAGAFATCFGATLSFVLSGALYGGLTLLYLRRIRGQTAAFTEVFCCFGPLFLQLMLVWIATRLGSGLAMMLCLAPGLFLKIMWVFSLALVADRQMEFWPAMQTSWRVVLGQFARVAGLVCVAWLPVLLIEAYTGYLSFTFVMERFGPIDTWDLNNLQGQMLDFTRFATKLELQKQLVFLLNLPLALASILYAYEDIFGARHSQDG